MEFEILYFLQGLHQPLLDRLMVGITSLGNGGWFWIALTVLFLCLPKYRRCGITMAVALVLNFLICNVAVKNLVARESPCWIDPSVELLIPGPKGFSFPSGHSSVSFAAAVAIFLSHKREGIAALVLAALIAFSRLYLFVHFPTDVLGGILTGIFCAAAAFYLTRAVEKKKQKKRGLG